MDAIGNRPRTVKCDLNFITSNKGPPLLVMDQYIQEYNLVKKYWICLCEHGRPPNTESTQAKMNSGTNNGRSKSFRTKCWCTFGPLERA